MLIQSQHYIVCRRPDVTFMFTELNQQPDVKGRTCNHKVMQWSKVTDMTDFITLNQNLLAEFEQYLFEYKHRPRAAQDGEGLPGEQGVGYPSQRGSKQRLNCTLGNGNKDRKITGAKTNCLLYWSSVQLEQCEHLEEGEGVLLCVLLLPRPAVLRRWWQGTCRHSTGTGKRPRTANSEHPCSQTGSGGPFAWCLERDHRTTWGWKENVSHFCWKRKKNKINCKGLCIFEKSLQDFLQYSWY